MFPRTDPVYARGMPPPTQPPASDRARINTTRAQKHDDSMFPRTDPVYARGMPPPSRPGAPGDVVTEDTPPAPPPPAPDCARINTIRAQKHDESMFPRTDRVYAWGMPPPSRPGAPGGVVTEDTPPAPPPPAPDCARINTIRAHKHDDSMFPRTNRVYARGKPRPGRPGEPGGVVTEDTPAPPPPPARPPARKSARINAIRARKHDDSMFPRTDRVYAWAMPGLLSVHGGQGSRPARNTTSPPGERGRRPMSEAPGRMVS
ncbi:hypothetical protein QE392_002256 [Microbacterium proteolyticum]|nr:hypothetical protein [Microbacterium sp. SORGH_AS_0344]MDQ1170452.1 hypothetical protein [Microbacterium proteolyticum]